MKVYGHVIVVFLWSAYFFRDVSSDVTCAVVCEFSDVDEAVSLDFFECGGSVSDDSPVALVGFEVIKRKIKKTSMIMGTPSIAEKTIIIVCINAVFTFSTVFACIEVPYFVLREMFPESFKKVAHVRSVQAPIVRYEFLFFPLVIGAIFFITKR